MTEKDRKQIEQMADPFYEIANAIAKFADVHFDCLASYKVGQALDAVGTIADALGRIADVMENQ